MGRKMGFGAVEQKPAARRESEMSLLQQKYKNEVLPAVMEEFGFTNQFQAPRVEKVIVNMGLGEAVQTPKVIESAVAELALITGQKAVVTRARRSVATFKLREGMPIGAKVTLRGDRMWEFLERLIYVALPRVRDFKGISDKAFDGHGNYSIGIREQIIFPEIEYDKVDKVRGMNITIVTSGDEDDASRSLLRGLGMPFIRRESRQAAPTGAETSEQDGDGAGEAADQEEANTES